MADKPDWFKMDPSKFMQDCIVETMTTLELGMTFRLLCRQWIDGFIPDDQATLARLCRVDRSAMGEAWEILCKFFPEIEPGKRANRFMWVERETVLSAMKKREEDGRASVLKRWDAIRDPKETHRPPIADLIQDKDKDKDKDKEVSSPSAPPISMSTRKKEKKIRTTGLKPESIESFDFLWSEFPKTHTKWDEVAKEWKKIPNDPGSKIKAETRFQEIVDAGVATPYELYSAFHAYVVEWPKVKEGFVQQVSTFLGLDKATYLQWLERARQLIQEEANAV